MARWLRGQVRRGFFWVAVLGAAVALFGGIAVFSNGFDRYNHSLTAYLDAFKRQDVVGIKRHVCDAARERFAGTDEWDAAIEIERHRFPDIEDIYNRRGERRTAHIVIRTGDGDETLRFLPIVEEDDRLVPCPVGDRLLGESSPD